MSTRHAFVFFFAVAAVLDAGPVLADKVKKRDTIASLEDRTVEVRPGSTIANPEATSVVTKAHSRRCTVHPITASEATACPPRAKRIAGASN